MENMEKKVCVGCGNSSCSCDGAMGMSCMHGCGHGKCSLLRVVLKIFIVIIIFWCGFRLGSIVGYIRAEYGGGVMMQREWNNNGGFGMMRTNDFYQSAPATNPSGPTTQTPVNQ